MVANFLFSPSDGSPAVKTTDSRYDMVKYEFFFLLLLLGYNSLFLCAFYHSTTTAATFIRFE